MNGRKCLEQLVSTMQIIQAKERRIKSNSALSPGKWILAKQDVFIQNRAEPGHAKEGKEEKQSDSQTCEREGGRGREHCRDS